MRFKIPSVPSVTLRVSFSDRSAFSLLLCCIASACHSMEDVKFVKKDITSIRLQSVLNAKKIAKSVYPMIPVKPVRAVTSI